MKSVQADRLHYTSHWNYIFHIKIILITHGHGNSIKKINIYKCFKKNSLKRKKTVKLFKSEVIKYCVIKL